MVQPGSIEGRLINGSTPVRIDRNELITKITEIAERDDLPFITSPLIDTHTHGGSGISVSRSTEELNQLVAHGRKFGVNQMILSLVSASIEEIEAVLGAASDIATETGLIGIHLEGPYIASERCGAHVPDQLRDLSNQELARILQFPSLKSITVASERVSVQQVSRLAEAGVTVALGHTNASYEIAKEYFASGAKVLTHAFNAMPQIESRAPGPVIAALETGAWIEIIADGHHVKPALVRQLANWAGDKLIAVTDSMAAAGMNDGSYTLGDVAVEVKNSVARRSDNGALAGSTLTLNQAVKNLIAWGVAPKSAIAAASANAAKCYGLAVQELEVGSKAEMLLWDQEFNLIAGLGS